MAGGWPEAFDALCRELRADRGRPGFIDPSDPLSQRLIARLVPLVGKVVSIGDRVAAREQAPTVVDLVGDIGGSSTLLVDIEVLYAPALHLEVVSQLRRTSQDTALIVVWPGRIAGGRLSYSLPGRADHFDEPARDLVVLRPTQADFPDEVPYTVERYPA
jgi:hypothetical protein